MGFTMREFINAATTGSAGSALTGVATGQLVIGAISLAFMIAFGLWGAWIKWRDSKAFQKALQDGELEKVLNKMIQSRGK